MEKVFPKAENIWSKTLWTEDKDGDSFGIERPLKPDTEEFALEMGKDFKWRCGFWYGTIDFEKKELSKIYAQGASPMMTMKLGPQVDTNL